MYIYIYIHIYTCYLSLSLSPIYIYIYTYIYIYIVPLAGSRPRDSDTVRYEYTALAEKTSLREAMLRFVSPASKWGQDKCVFCRSAINSHNFAMLIFHTICQSCRPTHDACQTQILLLRSLPEPRQRQHNWEPRSTRVFFEAMLKGAVYSAICL